MFKNTLFLKIILIFTLPALGILYFSSVLVYEKIQSFNEVDGINHNLTYLINTEKLINSLQEERELSVLLLLEKSEKSSLQKSRELSTKNYEELEKTLKNLNQNLDNKVIQLKSEINKLELFRARIDNSDATLDEIFEEYNQFDKVLLDSLFLLKPIKLAFDFNNEFRNIVHFLSFRESICIEKTMVDAYFINTKINDKLYIMLMKNYSLLEINKDIFLNNANLEIVQRYNSKLNEEYYNKIFIIRNGIKNKNFSTKLIKIVLFKNISFCIFRFSCD
ncbi:MAG: nitrate- and nitrite sensing domain-containing protein [Campylobacterales bacterium]|nr:nitrate- and nitrite sensing domain-containing protein [Campylobacterales bacterium]